ncbi:putative proline dehydrogenase 2 [Acipenser ruthenus]|uniref:Proline dehydrogenase n=1 Tax=Acipenser ruthenus TaxID=7906 RepID=A0A444V0J9_ACIRT|nr:putative proline dehydrogenase 2 [Acipenser ruthenus]
MLCADPASTLSFDDGRAFRLKRTSEIVRALTVFRLCSVPVLVTHCDKLLSFSRSLLGPRLFSLLMRATAYGQEQQYDENLAAMLDCVRISKSGAKTTSPMMQLKVTALLSAELCKRIAVLLSHPGLSEQFSLTRLLHAMEGQEYAKCQEVRVLVDAEYTYINPALTLVTMAMMKKFNQSEPWIWNTYQCYLKSLDMMLDLIAKDSKQYSIIIASHNEDSVKHAMKRMQELGIPKDGACVCFGQLLGMCDHVSLTLGQEGYAIYKSIPYGSIDSVLPYLVRRAQENRTVLLGIRKERELLRRELWRRVLRRSSGPAGGTL